MVRGLGLDFRLDGELRINGSLPDGRSLSVGNP